MKTAKKLLSVILSLTMLLGIFSVMASAVGTDTAIDIYIKSDKSTYKPGETITLTIAVQTIPDVGELYCGSAFPIAYSSKVIEEISSSSMAADHNVTAKNGSINMPNSRIMLAEKCDATTYDDGPDANAGFKWDKITTTGITSYNVGFDASAAVTDMFTMDFKIKDDAQPGTYHVGIAQSYFVDEWAGYVEDAATGGVYALDDSKEYYSKVDSIYGFYDCEFTVANEADAGPVVDKAKAGGAQVKFTANAPGTSGVDDDFKLRIKSEITQADWDTYFANTAEGGNNAITEVGIVAYQGKASEGFDAETAKKVVNGEPTEKYSTAKTDYIQKTATNAYFGAIINLKHTTCDYDITYMGYVKYTDGEGQPQVAFYNTSYEAGVSTNYDTAVSTFLAQ